MSFKAKHLYGGFVAIVLSCAAATAIAAPTVCTIIPATGSTFNATIAVASNFYGPAQDLVTSFAATPAGSGKRFRICQNSTATLDTEIRTGSSGYSLFLAANAATPDALQPTAYVQTGATSQLYAKGVPVIFAPTTAVPTVGDFITGQGSGTSATISGTVSSAQAINVTTVQKVAVANPALAPYGKAASDILRAMSLWNYPTDPVPSWMHNPLYDNIDLTYAAIIGGTDKSGFVSKSQICGNLGLVTYIEFTGYLLDQKGILINSGNATQNALGGALMNYMLSNPSPTFWSTFLTNHCYATI